MTDNTIDPNETRDFSVDWAPQLAAGETVTEKAVSIVDQNGALATNATVDSSTLAGAVVTFRLSAASGTSVYVLCRVTTSTGQILDDTWRLRVVMH